MRFVLMSSVIWEFRFSEGKADRVYDRRLISTGMKGKGQNCTMYMNERNGSGQDKGGAP